MTTRLLLEVARSHVLKFLNSNVSGTKRDVVPKQRYDRYPSVRYQILASLTFEYAWATPRHTVIGGPWKSKE